MSRVNAKVPKCAGQVESTVLRCVEEKLVAVTQGERGTWFVSERMSDPKSRPLTLNVGEAKVFANGDEAAGAIRFVCSAMDIADTFSIGKVRIIREVEI